MTKNEKDLFENIIKTKGRGPVSDRFIFPPFSIFNARTKEWQERKNEWLNLGIESEIGRHNCLCYTKSISITIRGKKQGTSIFDPNLCEIIYRWFCPTNGQIVDPFSGGSVRGIVAGMLERKYWGCDLREEQIDANNKQSHKITLPIMPKWVCGDSMSEIENAPEADFIFSCPPYGNLERYSDLPQDLSTMDYHAFIAAYKRIIFKCVKKLKPDSFACFVVGDFRDKKGFYRNFVSQTIDGFEQTGAKLYNEGILVTNVGSGAIRVTRQFIGGRKFVKTHQNILVFCKGSWKKATDKCNV